MQSLKTGRHFSHRAPTELEGVEAMMAGYETKLEIWDADFSRPVTSVRPATAISTWDRQCLGRSRIPDFEMPRKRMIVMFVS